MPKIGLLSDTHGYLDPLVFEYFKECDEIWHAGDFGSIEVSDRLSAFKPLRGVYGNIDDAKIRLVHPLHNRFTIEGVTVWMTHIAGTPGRYDGRVKQELLSSPPNILVCGHSHILKVMSDKELKNMLYINPGAAGIHGFHKVKTIVRFEINKGQIQNMQAIELGKRSSIDE